MQMAEIWPALVPALLIAFGCGLVGAAAMARLRLLVDQPNARSSHVLPTPRGGGVGLVVGALAGALWLGAEAAWVGLAAGALVASVAGLADDARAQGAFVKFGAQFLAAALAMAGGAVFGIVHVPGVGPVDLGAFAGPVTFLWFVGLTNAYNFMDGLDALAASTGAVAALFAGLVLAIDGHHALAGLAFMLAAACSGFLPLNWPRARVFMGDVGSQFLGFSFAGLGVLAANADASGQLFWLVPLLLMHFLFDTMLTAARRAANGENVLAAHRGHLYQRLNQSGVSHGRVSALLACFAGVQGLAALYFSSSVAVALLAAFALQLAYARFVFSRATVRTP
jgi:UDP-GlcNAc:undecaprenyl-phosphate/decaprenyl-phosphate GlcNAc-1-phosphate transferase